MSGDQVRWKINALLKKYKEVVDNFSKSGRGNIEFEYFELMDDIFGKKKMPIKITLYHPKCAVK